MSTFTADQPASVTLSAVPPSLLIGAEPGIGKAAGLRALLHEIAEMRSRGTAAGPDYPPILLAIDECQAIRSAHPDDA